MFVNILDWIIITIDVIDVYLFVYGDNIYENKLDFKTFDYLLRVPIFYKI